jgi:predicted acyltransferase
MTIDRKTTGGLPDSVHRPSRWIALDALRGLTIGAMILVNNPGRWGAAFQYEQLRHRDWHGCTFTDFVFPSFVFCAGVAIVPAFARRLAQGVSRMELSAQVLRRGFWLFAIGLLLHSFPWVTFAKDRALLAPVLDVRVFGVLQRIAWCYTAAALLNIWVRPGVVRFVLAGLLLGYWALLTLVAAPGVDLPNIDVPKQTLQGWLDQVVIGRHMYQKGALGYDPEGILSTLPAIGSCLLGVEAGRLLTGARTERSKALQLMVGGLITAALGLCWSAWFPLNKPIWTSSYVLWTGGLSAVLLGLMHEAFAVRGWQRLAHPLQVYGVNALLVFCASAIVGRLVATFITWTGSDGKVISLKEWCFQAAFASWAPPKVASLLFALAWCAGFYVLLAQLYRRRIIWKV